MTTITLPQITTQTELRVATVVRDGLSTRPKCLPPWLFYDPAGSRLFDQITQLPEYYLTRTEREILAAHSTEIIAQAAESDAAKHNWNSRDENRSRGNQPARLRIVELGAGSADKTRLLLKAAVARQGTLVYEPVDVSASALEAARERIEREIPGIEVAPRILDYTEGLDLEPSAAGERRLVLYIGSSIGNFEPHQANHLLEGVRAGLEPGDALLLGVDLIKEESTLLAAYDDADGVTARFNLNLLARLNRELDADFDLDAFAHRAVWNETKSRIEMHLESRVAQRVRLALLDLEVTFTKGERMHTENSYKFAPGQAEDLLHAAGFSPESTWTDARGRFAVCLARVL
jgi:L-histidine Nalpha-methyltransferase